VTSRVPPARTTCLDWPGSGTQAPGWRIGSGRECAIVTGPTSARRAGTGQTRAESWTVLAKPGGNEFCVVRPKQTLIR